MPRVVKAPEPSQISGRARRILARTAAARAELEASIAGVELDGDPPEIGPRSGKRRNRIRS